MFARASMEDDGLGGRVEALAARGVVRHFRPGLVLIHEGDEGDTLYVVQTGRPPTAAA